MADRENSPRARRTWQCQSKYIFSSVHRGNALKSWVCVNDPIHTSQLGTHGHQQKCEVKVRFSQQEQPQ
jgi:hypothetical protein